MPYDHDKHRQAGEAIRHLRESAHLSQRQLGNKLGVSHTHVSNVENGKKPASKRILNKLEHALGWDIGVVRAILSDDEPSDTPVVAITQINLDVRVSSDGQCRKASVGWVCVSPTMPAPPVVVRLFPSRDHKLITVNSEELLLSFVDEDLTNSGFIDVGLSSIRSDRDWMTVDVVPPWGVHSVLQQFRNVQFIRQPEYPDYPLTVSLTVEGEAADAFDFFMVAGSTDVPNRSRLLVRENKGYLGQASLFFRCTLRPNDVFGVQWKQQS